MMRVKIVSPEGEQIVEDVATWTYDKLTLVVEFENGETSEFDRANVVERL